MQEPSPSISTAEVHVRDLDAAQTLASDLYGEVTISFPRCTAPLQWQLRRDSIGSATLVSAHLNLDGELRAKEMTPHYIFHSIRQSAAEISVGRDAAALVPGERGAMLNPGIEGRTTWRAGLRTLNVLVDQGALCAHLSALTGTTIHASPRFKLPVDLRRGPGADVHRIIQLLHEVSTRTEGAPASPHLLAHLREALYVGLLFGVESTVSHLLHRAPSPASLRAVRQAEEYLTAHASEPIAVADLAAFMGVGLRSLQRSFRSARGMSLRAFLTNARLDLARRHLQAAGPGTTVTQVLHASGFGHPGEFSAAYRRRFGESPSETLRRALGGRAERR